MLLARRRFFAASAAALLVLSAPAPASAGASGNPSNGTADPAEPGCSTNGNGNAYGCQPRVPVTPPPVPEPPQVSSAPANRVIPRPSTCALTYDLQGGSNSIGNPLSFNGNLTLANPDRPGFNFDGWYVGSIRVSTVTCLGIDILLSARWVALAETKPTPAPVPVPAPPVVAPPTPVKVLKDGNLTLRVQFAMNSSKLSEAAKDRIWMIAQKIPAGAVDVVIDVTGYVQDTPGSKNNGPLSTARAKAVVAEFKKYGVTAVFNARGVGILDKSATARQSFATISFRF